MLALLAIQMPAARAVVEFLVLLVIVAVICGLLEFLVRKTGNEAGARIVQVVSAVVLILWTIVWLVKNFL